MNLSQFFLILRARKWIIIAALLTTVLSTFVVSMLLPKTYKATATVLLNYKGMDPLTGVATPGQLLPGYMATQIDIISSKKVALLVIDQLGLARNPEVIAQFNESSNGKGSVQDWLADLLLKKLEVVPSRESSVVEISFKGADPAFVSAIANAFADGYQKVSVQLKVEPLKKASLYFNDQLKLLRDNVEGAQARLSKYQQENGIVSLDNRLDVENNRLNDLSAQLVGAQGQSMEAKSRAGAARSDDSPDVASNPLVQNLKISLGAAEARFAEMGQRLDRNHPLYQSTKAEVEKLRNDLNSAIKSTSSSVGNNAAILQKREADIRAALSEQKRKVLELNRTRDELNVLIKDVESAQRAFDATSQRFAQTRIEGQAEQSDIALLNPATPPMGAAGPKVFNNTLISFVLGSMLGIGLAMLAELMDRRVRSEEDLVAALEMPVLGVVEWNAAKRKPSALRQMLLPKRLRLN